MLISLLKKNTNTLQNIVKDISTHTLKQTHRRRRRRLLQFDSLVSVGGSGRSGQVNPANPKSANNDLPTRVLQLQQYKHHCLN